jgi:signal transduction histidine kinase
MTASKPRPIRRKPNRSAGWRPVALVSGIATAGALGTLAVGAGMGMHQRELTHLSLLLLPALAITVGATALAGPMLAAASTRQRLVATALVAGTLSLANLFVLVRLMVVGSHGATVIGVLLLYSLGAGVGVALALARSTATGVERVTRTARAWAAGHLDERIGTVGGESELEELARTLDGMVERLQDAIDGERASEAQRRDLITAVSHDLRTPLAGLQAMVEAIDEGVVDDPPTLHRYVAEMRGAVASMTTLVDDLFELVSLDAGAIVEATDRAPFGDVVRSALAVCETQAIEKGILLTTNLNGATDAPCSPRLVRVLQNLVQNAVRHTPAEGIVRIQATIGTDRLEVAVEDTGEGLPPGAGDRVFEPFWRGDPSRSGDGSGLGLALARRIVEAIGGTITAKSSPGAGSRFEVVLPTGLDNAPHYRRTTTDRRAPPTVSEKPRSRRSRWRRSDTGR